MLVGAQSKKVKNISQPQEEEQITNQQEIFKQFVLKSIDTRDYSGAVTFIDFMVDELGQPLTKEYSLWKGYSLFHLGSYYEAIDVYKQLLKEEPDDLVLNLYISSCFFYLREFEEARAYAEKGPSCDFQTRLFFHIAHQMNNEAEVRVAHSKLVGTLENQLCLAAIHYIRCHFQDAIDIYQKILYEQPNFLALNIYIGMCQFKLQNYSESNDSADQYLGINSDSAVALNLKSCDYLHLFDPDVAESQLLQIHKFSSASYNFINSLIDHNLCIFKDGEGGFTVLPPLVNALPEARFNLAVLYMRKNNPLEAHNLLESFVPMDVQDTFLKADVLFSVAQLTTDPAPLEEACSAFAEIGQSDFSKDTLIGRECLATAHFISNEYDQAISVLDSIHEAIGELDEYNYNKAMSLAALSRWAEAERYFLMVKNEVYTSEIFYTSWLCRCYIKNRKPEDAWKLYANATATEDAKTLLQIIANDCFLSGAYYYSMRAYDILSKYDFQETYKQGMIASAIGVFRNELATGSGITNNITEVLSILSSEPDAESVLNVIQNYIDSMETLNQESY